MSNDDRAALGERGASKPPVLWIVVPCYNEEEVLPETARRLSAKIDSLLSRGLVSEASRILMVDDGSSDCTWQMIGRLHAGQLDDLSVPAKRICGISLAHNAGHQRALYAGLMRARESGCDCAVSLDADLQDDPDAIDEMLARHAEGAEIVYGVRSSRATDTAFKRNTAEAFYGFMNLLGVEMVSDSAGYRLMGRRSLDALSQWCESNLFLRGVVPALGYPTARVWYERAERFAGESKYPLRKMIAFAIDGITSFSVAPIRLVTLMGLASVAIAVIMVVYALINRFRGSVVPGWTSLIVSIWFVGGMIMVSLGIVGEYVGKAYLETKRRPRYIVAEECL